MARRKTISDVAKKAGVSVATVDRVINGRQRVRKETTELVYSAAQDIGYHGVGLIKQMLRPELPRMTFGFVLNKQKHDFYQQLAKKLTTAVEECPLVQGKAIIEFSPSHTPTDFAHLMHNMAGRVDVMAATSVMHHDITEAVRELKEKKIPTFSILNDFAQGYRTSYVGVDNMKVGRLASWMIASSATSQGKVAIVVGGHRWHGHELREMGFRSHFREYSPNFQILDTLINLETRKLTYETVIDLLHRHKDLRGLYFAGGGMEGAVDALREERLPGEISVIVPELTDVSKRALSDRFLTMSISTPIDSLCRDVVALMVKSKLNQSPNLLGEYFLEPQIYLPESV